MTINITTNQKRQILDITEQLEEHLEGDGLLHIFVKHTTAAVSTADLDPGADHDLLRTIEKMTPAIDWQHPHDPTHFPDHLWGSLFKPSLTVPYQKGKLQLGTWQRVVFLEFDGPRERKLELTLIRF